MTRKHFAFCAKSYNYSYEFSRYEQAPGDVQKREVEARAAAKEE